MYNLLHHAVPVIAEDGHGQPSATGALRSIIITATIIMISITITVTITIIIVTIITIIIITITVIIVIIPRAAGACVVHAIYNMM